MRKKSKILKGLLATASLLFAQSALATPIWTTSFGSSGSGGEQFSRPSGIALDSTGKIYVTDYGNNRVQIFNKDTTFLSKFDGSGSGGEQLSRPSDIALDSIGKIYVTDSGNNQVQIFNKDTTFLSKFDGSGSGGEQFSNPIGIALDSTGKIYVTDYGNNRVQIFNKDTTFLSKFDGSGSGGEQFSSPSSIALDSTGKIYVTDYGNNRVQIFNKDTTFLSKFDGSGSGGEQFSRPRDIVLDSTGKIYVTDSGNNQVQIFNKDTTFLSKFDGSGSGGEQFSNPIGIALDSTGKIYVTDYGNNRVTVLFDPTLWTEAGEVILGTLALNQDLGLNSGYNLIVKPMDDSTSGTIKTSDGKLTITNSATLIANAGSTITATSVELNEGNLVVNTNTFTNPLQVGSNNNNITVGNNISFSSDISYSAVGSLTVNGEITGNVDFAGNEGILQLADGKTITGDVDSSTASAGTLEFLGKGTVTGSIGDTNMLTKLKFSGAGDSTIPAASAKTIEVANAGANVTASEILNSDVLFSADGSLVADKGVNGSITTSADNTGTITIGAGNITGAIGTHGGNKLTEVNFNGVSNVTSIDATIVKISNVAANVTATGVISGAVSYTADGSLVADKGVNGSITTSTDNTGTITIGAGNVGVVGATDKKLKQINLNQGAAASIGALYAGNVDIGGIGPITATDLLTSAVSFSSNGTLIANSGITGNVDFAGNEGILQLADGKTITGNVDSSTASAGTLEFLGKGTVTGSIGDTNMLTKLKFSGAGDSTIPAASAKTIEVANAGANVTASEILNSDVLFSADGSLVADKGVNGSITTSTDNTGTITIGAGNVGVVGATDKKLKQINLNQGAAASIGALYAGNVDIGGIGPITATDLLTSAVSFSSNGTLISNGGITGNVDFAGNEGILQLADGKTITGNVDSSTASAGTLEFLGKGAIDGVVTNLTMLKAGAGDVIFKTPGDYSITELQGNGSGIITFPSNMKYVGGMNITGGQPVNLNFANNNIINGNIGSSTSPVGNISSGANTEFNGNINSIGDIKTSGEALFAGNVACNNILANTNSSDALSSFSLFAPATTNVRNTINFDQDNVITKFQGTVHTKGGIKASGSTYFADTVNSQGNITINGDTKFNKTLSSGNNIDISHGSNVIFNGDVSSRSININSSNIQVSDNISIAGNISASNSTIILDNKMLTLSGINIFTNQLMINTTYDESSLSGGNIILAPGSTLDLSNVSELIVKLSFINSDISKIADNTKYNIILAEDGSNIVPLSDPEHQITLDSSGEQNKFVKWKLDANSLTLYAYDDSNNVIDTDYVFDSVQDNMFMEELKHVTPNSNAEEFKNNIGLLDKEQAEEMLSRILDHPKERDSAIVQVALHQTLTDTNKVAMNAIHDRLSNTGPTSAGDEDMCGCSDNIYEDGYRYGMWAGSSINHSKDKVSAKNAEYFSSYKTKGHSNTIGLDSLICDNILLGIAYTNAYTSIRPKDQNIGNIDKVRTNMFSLYSAYNIPNYNWYLNSTISYAESSIRSGKMRYTAIAKHVLDNEVASSKYKSHLYNGSISLGYNHYLGNNAYIVPSIGAIASLIRDKGYTETGTSFQNLTIRKKNYHKLSSIAGLRAYQDIYFRHLDNVGNASSLVVTPEAYGFVNYNIKNKSPATDARMQGIDERLPTIHYRSNKVDYNLGLGITIKHNMMEYGINYDANLAKKYQGHAGSIKVRVNL